jgi:hypothetical protein
MLPVLNPRIRTYSSYPLATYSEAEALVVRTSSKIDDQTRENESSNEGDFSDNGQQCPHTRKSKHTLDDREDKLGLNNIRLLFVREWQLSPHSPKYRTPKILIRQTRKQSTTV